MYPSELQLLGKCRFDLVSIVVSYFGARWPQEKGRIVGCPRALQGN